MNQFETLRQDLHENYGHEYTAAEIDAKPVSYTHLTLPTILRV